MTSLLEPVLTGGEREIEVRARRSALSRWRQQHPHLALAVLHTKGDYVRVRVLNPGELRKAGPECHIEPARAYRSGNSRNKRLWSINVRDEHGFALLDGHASKQAAEDAARQWFMEHGIDPATVWRA